MIELEGKIDIIEGDETLRVERQGKVSYIDGKPVKKEIFEFNITCNVQPMSSRDLLLVPEGDRYKEQYFVWSNNMDTPLNDNDLVQRTGVQDCKTKYYQVQSLENWGSYQKARIMLIDVGSLSND